MLRNGGEKILRGIELTKFTRKEKKAVLATVKSAQFDPWGQLVIKFSRKDYIRLDLLKEKANSRRVLDARSLSEKVKTLVAQAQQVLGKNLRIIRVDKVVTYDVAWKEPMGSQTVQPREIYHKIVLAAEEPQTVEVPATTFETPATPIAAPTAKSSLFRSPAFSVRARLLLYLSQQAPGTRFQKKEMAEALGVNQQTLRSRLSEAVGSKDLRRFVTEDGFVQYEVINQTVPSTSEEKSLSSVPELPFLRSSSLSVRERLLLYLSQQSPDARFQRDEVCKALGIDMWTLRSRLSDAVQMGNLRRVVTEEGFVRYEIINQPDSVEAPNMPEETPALLVAEEMNEGGDPVQSVPIWTNCG